MFAKITSVAILNYPITALLKCARQMRHKWVQLASTKLAVGKAIGTFKEICEERRYKLLREKAGIWFNKNETIPGENKISR